MNCPHCGKPISRKLIATALGKIKTPEKSQAARENGKLGGRPRTKVGVISVTSALLPSTHL